MPTNSNVISVSFNGVNIPRDLILLITNYLSAPDISNLSKVSRELRRMIEDIRGKEYKVLAKEAIIQTLTSSELTKYQFDSSMDHLTIKTGKNKGRLIVQFNDVETQKITETYSNALFHNRWAGSCGATCFLILVSVLAGIVIPIAPHVVSCPDEEIVSDVWTDEGCKSSFSNLLITSNIASVICGLALGGIFKLIDYYISTTIEPLITQSQFSNQENARPSNTGLRLYQNRDIILLLIMLALVSAVCVNYPPSFQFDYSECIIPYSKTLYEIECLKNELGSQSRANMKSLIPVGFLFGYLVGIISGLIRWSCNAPQPKKNEKIPLLGGKTPAQLLTSRGLYRTTNDAREDSHERIMDLSNQSLDV